MRYEELRENITAAMKAKDKLRLSILRQVLNEVDSSVKSDPKKDSAIESDVDAALKKTLKQTRETLEASEKVGTNQQRTNELAAQARMLEEYLPEQLDGEKLEQRIDGIISELAIDSIKGMGKIMGTLTAETGGNFDKGAAAAYAKSKLA